MNENIHSFGDDQPANLAARDVFADRRPAWIGPDGRVVLGFDGSRDGAASVFMTPVGREEYVHVGTMLEDGLTTEPGRVNYIPPERLTGYVAPVDRITPAALERLQASVQRGASSGASILRGIQVDIREQARGAGESHGDLARAMAHLGDELQRAVATPPTVMEQIDRAVDGLCPCGSEARPPSEELPGGSMYCSYDCEPNHHSVHTISDRDGTQMRWRPDMVTADPDDPDRRALTDRFRHGSFMAQVFERVGTDRLHLRLDDGHRFVGADVASTEVNMRHPQHAKKWLVLVEEMRNDRSAVPDPTPSFVSWLPPNPYAWNARGNHVHWAAPPIFTETAILSQAALRLAFGLSPATPEPTPTVAEVQLARRERALAARRNRNTGPARRPRAPRSINPHRAR